MNQENDGGVPITGGSPRQRAVLGSIAASFQGMGIQRLAIHRAGKGWRPSRKLGAYGSTWLTLRIATGSHPSEQAKASWLSALIAGAFRDRSHQLHQPDLLGYTPRLDLPSDRIIANGQIIGGRFKHLTDPADLSTLSSSVEERLKVAAQQSGGFDQVRMSFVKPRNLALLADISARSPRQASEYFYEHRPFSRLEGALILIRDSTTGEPVFAQTAAARANYGAIWIRDR